MTPSDHWDNITARIGDHAPCRNHWQILEYILWRRQFTDHQHYINYIDVFNKSNLILRTYSYDLHVQIHLFYDQLFTTRPSAIPDPSWSSGLGISGIEKTGHRTHRAVGSGPIFGKGRADRPGDRPGGFRWFSMETSVTIFTSHQEVNTSADV